MNEQFYECEPCPKSVYGHKFEARTMDNGNVVWICSLCGATRGFCQHEVVTDSYQYFSPEVGMAETELRYCKHCYQDMDGIYPEKGKLTEEEIDDLIQKNEYGDYLELGVPDPRD